MEFCWLAPKQEEIELVAAIAQKDSGNQQTYPFCHCQEGKEHLISKSAIVVKSWLAKLEILIWRLFYVVGALCCT